MKKQEKNRKEVARKRIRGLLIFVIIILSLVLFYDVYLMIKDWVL